MKNDSHQETTEQRRLRCTMAARDRIVAAILAHGDKSRHAEALGLAEKQRQARLEID